ncbi:ABC transporter permease [Nocardioides panacisoli]|uniref:Multidrug efflux ABC transporter permease n=1 Tax=Nocardioides panacisoli TaxID=627624 RepID=A0ABP7J2V7_9ACTN
MTRTTTAGTLTGAQLLVRLALRRDRVLAPVWIGVLVLMSVASAAATAGLYPDLAERTRVADAVNASPAIVALYGPILDPSSIGELAMSKMTVLYAVFAAVLFIVVVRRHTRVEEESGRTELVGGTSVGRDAPLAAAIMEAVLLAVVLGVLTALGNALGGLDPLGSVAFGALWTGTGLVAAGIGAVAAQMSASARTCSAFAAAVVGTLYVLRAAGDTGPQWLSWLSPFGWNTQVQAYGDTRWWLLLAYPALAAGLVLVAQQIRARRDLGSGLIAARPGPPVGSPRLGDAIGLAIRVHTTAITLWSAAFAVLGVVFGMIAPGIDDIIRGSSMQGVLDKLGGYLIAAILSIVAVVASYFTMTVVSHTSHDETDGRTELVLATTTSRSRWFAATALVAFAGVTWLLVVTGVGLSVGYLAADGPDIGSLVLAALGWAPAVWVTGALGALCFALGPRWTPVGWAWPAMFLTLEILGDLFDLPGWVTGLSPYQHVPALPAEPWDWPAEIGLTALAAALLAVAWWRFRERDIG